MQIVQCKDLRKKTVFDTKYETLIFFSGLHATTQNARDLEQSFPKLQQTSY